MTRHPHTAGSSLGGALKPALPRLITSVLVATLSGLAYLGALWCLIQLIQDPSGLWIYRAAGLMVACAFLASFSSWLAHHAETQFAGRLRRLVARQVARMPPSVCSARWDDKKLRGLLADDINALHHLVAHLPAEIATFVVVPLASILMLVSMAGPQALLVLLPGLVASLYYLWLMPRVSARYGEQRASIMSDIVTAVDDYVRGIRVSRLYGTESGALARYHQATRRFTEGMVTWVKRVATAGAVAVALLQAVATFAVAYVITHDRDPAVIAAALFFGLAIVIPASRLGHGLDYVATGRNAARRLADFLRETPLKDGELIVTGDRLRLEATDLTLKLGDRSIIAGANYRFLPGQLAVINGPSGVGKTTLIHALAGLEPPQKGIISLSGNDLSLLDEANRHQCVQLLPQQASVLPASVRENLALSAPGQTDDQYEVALQQAWLEVDLDAHAPSLSGGEQQRLGLARMFLSAAPVLLLDEPTSALDETTAGKLIKTLRQHARDRHKTVVAISHDPALFAGADQQLTMSGKPTREDRK